MPIRFREATEKVGDRKSDADRGREIYVERKERVKL